MSTGLDLFVIVLTIANIVAAVWLLWWMRKRRGESSKTTDTTGHVWDGDLREYNNPLPRWWLWLFVLTVVFSLIYFVLYPALGTTSTGVLGWTQQKQWRQLQAEQEKKAQLVLARFDGVALEDLARDPSALKIGRNLFANNCAACHGSDGAGAIGFPNLTDADWLWGSDPATILASIHEGRLGAMPGWEAVLGRDGVEDLVAYVLTLSGRTPQAGNTAAGRTQFELLCSACHGADGRGVQAVGGPNLTDNIWLHGGSVDAIRGIIANGVNNAMPAQGERLGEQRVRLLAAYVMSLGTERVAQGGP